MAQSKFKPITMKPLTGLFDNRSSVDEMVPGSFRWKENWSIDKDGKLSRSLGFTRAFESTPATNADWHDQGVAMASREPVTSFFPSTANNGTRRLFAATKTRILLLNESTGNWTTIASGLGQDGQPSLTQLRFSIAELQNKVYFTNDFDRVKYYDLDAQTFGDVPTLNTSGETDFVDVSKAKRVISWNGVIFLLNTVEGGTRFSSRIRWSNLNDGLNWSTTPPSISDFQDLDYSHSILSAVPIGNALFEFADRSIWRCVFSVDVSVPGQEDAVLTCVKVYDEPRNKAKCLVFPNTLISNGRSAFYVGADGWYEYAPGQMAEPERPEWAHRATGIVFSGTRAIDTDACASPVSEYRPAEDTIYLSWGNATPTSTGLNQHTMAFNLKHKTAAYLNYGSVSLINFTSDKLGVGGCNATTKFLSSNSVDFTIKELDAGESREMYDPVTGLYSSEGFYSILRFVFPFERMMEEKEIASYLAEIVAVNPNDTAIAQLRIGTSDRAVDPNEVNGKCGVLWHPLSSRAIKCAYSMTPEQYVAAGIRPADPAIEWGFLYRGRFLFTELTLAAADGTAAKSGSCAISRMEVSARLL